MKIYFISIINIILIISLNSCNSDNALDFESEQNEYSFSSDDIEESSIDNKSFFEKLDNATASESEGYIFCEKDDCKLVDSEGNKVQIDPDDIILPNTDVKEHGEGDQVTKPRIKFIEFNDINLSFEKEILAKDTTNNDPKIEFIFLIDLTGSMKNEIAGVRKYLNTIRKNLTIRKATSKSNSVSFKFIGFAGNKTIDLSGTEDPKFKIELVGNELSLTALKEGLDHIQSSSSQLFFMILITDDLDFENTARTKNLWNSCKFMQDSRNSAIDTSDIRNKIKNNPEKDIINFVLHTPESHTPEYFKNGKSTIFFENKTCKNTAKNITQNMKYNIKKEIDLGSSYYKKYITIQIKKKQSSIGDFDLRYLYYKTKPRAFYETEIFKHDDLKDDIHYFYHEMDRSGNVNNNVNFYEKKLKTTIEKVINNQPKDTCYLKESKIQLFEGKEWFDLAGGVKWKNKDKTINHKALLDLYEGQKQKAEREKLIKMDRLNIKFPSQLEKPKKFKIIDTLYCFSQNTYNNYGSFLKNLAKDLINCDENSSSCYKKEEQREVSIK